ncbi:MAG TPA: nucleotidyltransferase family protein [bacterium]|nr:nucleotidyltransferase family protein [bacterium]HPN45896.1 nucleotidyltransferase family protein [bacterium]
MKSSGQIKNLLIENKARLQKKYAIRQLGLFGSWVRNEQTAESDLDLLVTFTKKPSLFQFIELENELSALLGVKVDLVMESALKPRIGENIRKEVVNL